jgi:hypothetical protein
MLKFGAPLKSPAFSVTLVKSSRGMTDDAGGAPQL